MAEPVTLSDIKVHLRLDESATDEDPYLTAMIVAARRTCEARICRSIADPVAPLTEDDQFVLCQAIRLIVAAWYANREGVSTDARTMPVELPLAVTWLLEPLRKWASE